MPPPCRRKERDLRGRHDPPRLHVAQGSRPRLRRGHVVSTSRPKTRPPRSLHTPLPPSMFWSFSGTLDLTASSRFALGASSTPNPARFWIFYRLRNDFDTFIVSSLRHPWGARVAIPTDRRDSAPLADSFVLLYRFSSLSLGTPSTLSTRWSTRRTEGTTNSFAYGVNHLHPF